MLAERRRGFRVARFAVQSLLRSSFAETDRLAPGKPAGDGSGISGISDGVSSELGQRGALNRRMDMVLRR